MNFNGWFHYMLVFRWQFKNIYHTYIMKHFAFSQSTAEKTLTCNKHRKSIDHHAMFARAFPGISNL